LNKQTRILEREGGMMKCFSAVSVWVLLLVVSVGHANAAIDVTVTPDTALGKNWFFQGDSQDPITLEWWDLGIAKSDATAGTGWYLTDDDKYPYLLVSPSQWSMLYKSDAPPDDPNRVGDAIGIDIDPDTGEPTSFFGPYYETVFNPSTGDYDAAVTTNIGPNYITGYDNLFLVVQDGNADPSQYIFDISGWDGLGQLLIGSDPNGLFWGSTRGSISNISIYGAWTSEDPDDEQPPFGVVPEPASLAIWSILALGGAGLAARRRGNRRRWSDESRQAIYDVVIKA
jgi:hypothetical protein